MRIITFVGILGLSLTLAGTGAAGDMCFDTGLFAQPPGSKCGALIVAKKYKKPPAGGCRAVVGYEASTAVPYPASGTVCLNAAGTRLIAAFTIPLSKPTPDQPGLPWQSMQVGMDLSYPSLSSGDADILGTQLASGTFGCSSGFASAAPCVPAPLP